MTTIAQISLGSNLGDRQELLQSALRSLNEEPGIEILAVSRFHETAPVGGPSNQGAFLNAAATLRTSDSADGLLARLQAVENQFGRSRHVRWDARTLDLDLLLFGTDQVKTVHLEVPHPRFALRPFVLNPLEEIAPTVLDPVTQMSISDLAANLRRKPHRLSLLAEPSVADLCFMKLNEALPVAGWQILLQQDRCPTFIVVVEAQSSPLKCLTAGERWQLFSGGDQKGPKIQHPPAPVYWLDSAKLEVGLPEVVTISRGIADG